MAREIYTLARGIAIKQEEFQTRSKCTFLFKLLRDTLKSSCILRHFIYAPNSAAMFLEKVLFWLRKIIIFSYEGRGQRSEFNDPGQKHSWRFSGGDSWSMLFFQDAGSQKVYILVTAECCMLFSLHLLYQLAVVAVVALRCCCSCPRFAWEIGELLFHSLKNASPLILFSFFTCSFLFLFSLTRAQDFVLFFLFFFWVYCLLFTYIG